MAGQFMIPRLLNIKKHFLSGTYMPLPLIGQGVITLVIHSGVG